MRVRVPSPALSGFKKQINPSDLTVRAGSSPARGTTYSRIAQLVEQMTDNHWVTGSSPVSGAIFFLELFMNYKFRKKPVEIEAFQMTKERRLSNEDWPTWMHRAWQLERGEIGSLYPTVKGTGEGTLSIGTLEGQHLVSWGDWIIRGVKGDIYPCKPDIFELTYDPVE